MSDLTTTTGTTLTTSSMGDVVVERTIITKPRRYRWPELLLGIILLLLLVCGAVVLGAFGYFTYIQQRLFLYVPWFVPLSSIPPLSVSIRTNDFWSMIAGGIII